jgi:hypothetical protein
MNRRSDRKWMLLALVSVLLALAVIPAGTEAPERALDMWGVEHDLKSSEWTLFDFVHVAGCGYCVLNAAAYQENFGEALEFAGVRTFGVDVYESQRDLIDYVKHHDIRFPILTEPDVLWSALECPGLPGQSLFRGDTREWGRSETLTFRNYDRIRRSVGALPPFRPAGPLKKALNCVYEDERALVVVGDGYEPEVERYFPGLRKIVFRVKRASEVVNADLVAGSIYVIGSPAENNFHERLNGRTPFRISPHRIAFADTAVSGDDLLLWYCCPSPWNAERYLVVKTGTAPSSMQGHIYGGSQDFTIARRTAEGVISIASGICDKSGGVWSLSSEEVVWTTLGGPPAADVAACGPSGCEVPMPSGTVAAEPAPEPATSGALAPRVEFEWSAPGRFVALSAEPDGACWAAWDRPGEGVFSGRIEREGCRPVNLWAGERGLLGMDAAVDAFKASVVAESSERAWLAWSEKRGDAYGVYAARVGGGGEPDVWEISHRSNLDHHAPALALGDSARVWLAWYAWEANARRPYARAWTGAGWTPVSAVPTADGSQFAWYFAGTRAGANARFVWMQHYPDLTGIVAATLAPEGWGEPRVLARTGRYPSLAYDATRKESRVVWQQWERERSTRERFAWSIMTAVERGGRWSDPVPLPRCPEGRNETPVVCVDGSGCTWVFWAHKSPAGDGMTPRWQVVCEVHDGQDWRGPYVVSDPGVDARSPAVTSSNAVWVGWHEGTGSQLTITVKRIRAWNEANGNTVGTSWTKREATKNS